MARRFFDITSAINAIVQYEDAHAFEFIFNTFYDKLYRVAYYYMSSDENAEDAVSEVFYKLWNNRKKLNKIENLENYLFFMIRNQCLSTLRAGKKITYTDQQDTLKQQITTTNPENSLISEEFIRYLSEHISSLPPRCRIIFIMVKEDGLKYKEVAEILNISIKTVENQMTKAIGYLRKIVSAYNTKPSSTSKSE